MQQITFGSTNLTVGRTGFGCIPIQRIPFEESTAILRHAYESGVTLFDTANVYTTSEARIGTALSHVRDKIVLCTKSHPGTTDVITANIDNSLKMMQTDYIDVLQLHNPPFMPRPGGEDGVYDCLLAAKKQGKIRHIGISAHGLKVAEEAVTSGLYEVLQFPFSYLSTEKELQLIGLCKQHNVGVLAMKGLCGGILSNAKAAFTFLRQFENLIPIWGIEKMEELTEFLSYEENPPTLDTALQDAMDADRAALSENFCRACGYCLPCPAEIPIPMAARMSYLMRRMAQGQYASDTWKENMGRISDCSGCGHCAAHCPYEIDTPKLLKEQQKIYFKEVD